MIHKKVPIKYKKERVVLSDILPYEIPVTYSSRHLYQFLVKNKINIDSKKISWQSNQQEELPHIVKLLFGVINKEAVNDTINLNEKDFVTIPFGYNISHKEDDFRKLTIIHPINQLCLVSFYDQYKELILYYCNVSQFSLRRPHSIAKFTYWKDKTHYNNLADGDHEELEEYEKEYESLKTFFRYKNYSNIHKFFESYKYHRCEKKYNKMVKFDISKCFDSIYTHSLSWALLNKDIVKDVLNPSKVTFGGLLDKVMTDLNYGETNGIVIGPEFSRIFAEMILQEIDKKVYHQLKDLKFFFKKDYEIFRYVDDFFVFYNEEDCKVKILKTVKLELDKFNLHLNDSKSKLYEKPLITEITIAKQKISDLINKSLCYNIKEVIVDEDEAEKSEKKYSLYISSNKLITKFKTIVKETNVEYKDILNYTLASIDRKVLKLIKDYNTSPEKARKQKVFTTAILEILDFSFFIYSVSPRVNTTIKLCILLSKITKFYSTNTEVNYDNKHLIYKKIYDDISLVLQNNSNSEHIPVETLYLLIALRELGRGYRLDTKVLCDYFDIDSISYTIRKPLNYLSTVVLLFYIGDKKKYLSLLESLKKHSLDKFLKVGKDDFGKHAELVYLLFDLIACPFVGLEYKMKLLFELGIETRALRKKIIYHRKYWFTKWSNFKFDKEMEAKRSVEVY